MGGIEWLAWAVEGEACDVQELRDKKRRSGVGLDSTRTAKSAALSILLISHDEYRGFPSNSEVRCWL